MRRLSSTAFSSKDTSERVTSTGTTFTPQPVIVVEKSPWHSPMPYLFGGLAAMLGLIAFALLILACSYWKLYRQTGTNNNTDDNNDETSTATTASNNNGSVTKGDEGVFLVIMAGDLKPTCLATPVISSVCLTSMKKDKEDNIKQDFIISDNIKEEETSSGGFDTTLTQP